MPAQLNAPMTTREEHINFTQVWGGNRARDSHLVRPGLEAWIWSRSTGRAEAGGADFHLVSSCASGRITRMLLADICGHGRLFREVAEELRALMKRNVNSVRQTRMVRALSERMASVAPRGGFASLLLSTYFAPTRSFAACNAGHPPPLLYRTRERAWLAMKQVPTNLRPAATPLGAVDQAEYQQFQTKLEIGDLVLGYSNTLTECRSADGRTLGIEGLLQHVRQLDAEQPRTLVASLASRLQRDEAGNPPAEDATVVLCRATGSRVSWRDNLLAPLRLLCPVSDATQIS